MPFSARADWHREFSDGSDLVIISASLTMTVGMMMLPMPPDYDSQYVNCENVWVRSKDGDLVESIIGSILVG
jgi:hypothetical protein